MVAVYGSGNGQKSVGLAPWAANCGIPHCLAITTEMSVGEIDESRSVHGSLAGCCFELAD